MPACALRRKHKKGPERGPIFQRHANMAVVSEQCEQVSGLR
jgi:hypothetical protein